MTQDARSEARQKLGTLIERAMSDGKIDDSERAELQGLYRQAVLTVTDVREVLGRYLRALQDDVLADGRVTEEERTRCRAVVSELKIPHGLLTPQIKAIVGIPG
jgi:uncharacterized membrane protein YebE (DUF533 family)